MSAVHVHTLALLVLGVLAPGVVIVIHLLDRRRQDALMARLGELPAVRRMMAARSPGRRWIKAVLTGVALGLVLIGASRPWISTRSKGQQQGIDMVVALDVSKSMLVGDVQVGEPKGHWPADLPDDAPRPVPPDPSWVQGTRLERGRQVLDALFDQVADDRIGVILFAGAAVHFPLTDDPKLATTLIHEIGASDLTGGSDVGEAVREATCLLRGDLADPAVGCVGIDERGHGGDDRSPDAPRHRDSDKPKSERGKAILIVTDGGNPSPDVARKVDAARQLGIAVYFIGVGSDQGGVVPELDYDGKVAGPKLDASGNVVHVSIDRKGMQALADVAGGADHYIEIAPKGPFDVAPILAGLAQVPRGDADKNEEDRPHELYHWFLFPGLMLLVIEATIGLRRRVKHPEDVS